VIHLVWGRGHAETPKASFDAALARAGVHQYNLRQLSSVIPAGPEIRHTGTAPDLGPAGNALDVVMARETSPPGTAASAGLAWTDREGPGIFYEVADTDPETVRDRLQTGIERGCAIREYDPATVERKIISAEPDPDRYTTAVVLATYGTSESLIE
jgi:arginine decarboxylase